MPLAKDYVCYSIRSAMKRTGLPAKTLADIGVGCTVTGVQAERIARFAARALRVRLWKVYVKDVAKGRAHPNYNMITLPHFIFHGYPKAYIVYYIVHEVAHLHNSAVGQIHGPPFKRVERRILKRFGLGIRYKHAYPRELFALKDGRKLYESGRLSKLKVQTMKRTFSLTEVRQDGMFVNVAPAYLQVGDLVRFQNRKWAVIGIDETRDSIQLGGGRQND